MEVIWCVTYIHERGPGRFFDVQSVKAVALNNQTATVKTGIGVQRVRQASTQLYTRHPKVVVCVFA